MDAIRQFLAEHPYFRDLPAPDREGVARLATMRTLVRGEILALEGEPCTTVYFVIQGRLRAIKSSPQGREQVVSELLPGQTFYLPPALDGGPLPATTQAATRATLLGFSQRDFLALLQNHRAIAMQVLVDFARRLRQLSSLVETLSLRSVPDRLARLLLEQVQAPTDHQLTQREMAAQLGTVREVLARALARFEDNGWIHLRRGVIEVVDPQALRQFIAAEEL
jgi:CRP-like cAMP-binding protein